MAKRQLVTLLTDFSTRDPYVAAMKGVLLRHCPRAEIIDITHEIAPQDVLSAAFVLAEATRSFPDGTLHVVVVDPGVGTDRRILAGDIGGQRFLCPDNGVITFVAESREQRELVVVSNSRYVPAATSRTFHGRDIFAPVAAHILNGVDLARLGPRPKAFTMLDVPRPVVAGEVLAGQIVYVDRFGNLVSNIPIAAVEPWCAALDAVRVSCDGREVGALQGTYDFVERGAALALVNSMGLIEVAVNGGSAAAVLDAGVGATVRLRREARGAEA
ncbi:MAG: SAM-dependent chlorinase/fluorinase [Phycisphaerae bacterium]|nr:SAM-dependent chlorinase/fluorinase [Phycisphaerae bacterium]